MYSEDLDNGQCDVQIICVEDTNTAVKTDREREHVQKAPDGGWGWAVCAACFMSHVLTDGIFYSFGVVFVELLDYYKGSKGETAMIASLSTGVCFFGGKYALGKVTLFIMNGYQKLKFILWNEFGLYVSGETCFLFTNVSDLHYS